MRYKNLYFKKFIFVDKCIFVILKELTLYAITSKGSLSIYRHTISDKVQKKPIKAANQVEVETNEGVPLHIIFCYQLMSASSASNGTEAQNGSGHGAQLLLSYGSYLAPKFERIVRFLSLRNLFSYKIYNISFPF